MGSVPLPDEARRRAEGVARAQAAAMGATAPGVVTKHLPEVIEGTLQEEGMGSTIEMAGHAAGLNPQEPPMIAEEEESVFEEGMGIAVELRAAHCLLGQVPVGRTSSDAGMVRRGPPFERARDAHGRVEPPASPAQGSGCEYW